MLNKTGRTLRILVRILRLDHTFCSRIPMPITFVSSHTVLMVQPNVEPHRGIEGPVLMEAQPCQLTIKPLAVLGRRKITIAHTPIGDRPRHAVDQLTHAVLTLGCTDLTIKIFAANNVRCQLAPKRRHFAVSLLKDNFAPLALDLRGPRFPLDCIHWISHITRTKLRLDLELTAERPGRTCMDCL